jgi:hypothetical protein
MSAADRQYMLDQGAYAVAYCKDNATLNGLYSCSCFSQKVFDARIKTNGQTVQVPDALRSGGKRDERTPFTNLIFKLDIRDCVVPAKIEKYGSDRAYQVLKMDTQLSRTQLDQVSACVGSSLASSFQVNPVPNTVVIDGLFNSALIPCREKAVGGGSSASAPPAGSSQAQPVAQAAPQTAVGQPAAPQHRSTFDRLNQARNRANDAIRGTTGTNPAQPSNQSPQVPAPHSAATNQQVDAPAPSPSTSPTPSRTSSGRQFYHFCKLGGATRPEGGGIQYHAVAMPLYVSDIYPVPMDKGINNADGVAFAQFLGEKYDPYFKKVRASCGGIVRSMEAAQADKQKLEDEYRNNARLSPSMYPNSNVIETGWKWTGAGSSQGVAPDNTMVSASRREQAAPHQTAVGQPAPAPPPQSPPAQEPRFIAADLTGVYNGKYRCAQGPTNFKLTLVAAGDGSMSGEFTFDLPATSSTRTASYSLSGKYDSATGNFRLNPVKWEPPEPRGFVMVGMDGTFNPNTKQVSGKITSPTCSTFEATR